MSTLLSWGLRIGVIGAIVGGGLIFRDRMTGAASELRVGDCFDEPAAAGEVSEVQHRPCNEEHDAEVVFVGDYPDQETFPGESAFDGYALANCVPAFETYIGRDYETDTEYGIGVFYPIAAGWREGDHEISCYVSRIDGLKLTSSVKSGG